MYGSGGHLIGSHWINGIHGELEHVHFGHGCFGIPDCAAPKTTANAIIMKKILKYFILAVKNL